MGKEVGGIVGSMGIIDCHCIGGDGRVVGIIVWVYRTRYSSSSSSTSLPLRPWLLLLLLSSSWSASSIMLPNSLLLECFLPGVGGSGCAWMH